jgi:flagellar basal body-associated protein FliL
MSDDTPTQRFPATGDDATGEVQENLQEEKKKSRGLLIGLIAAGALLLVAIIVLVVVLLPKGAGDIQAGNTQSPQPQTTDTPAPTETATPTPAATAEPTQEPEQPQQPQQPQQPSGPAITSFTVSPATVYCNTQAPVQPQNQYLSMSWKTVGADEIRIGTYDPYGDYSVRYYDLPPNGNQNSIGQDIIYQCPEATQTWRLEIVANGQVIKKEVTIQNKGDLQ